ncbi:unnamed protein product [Closterium sp. NIES-53]
MDSRHGLLHMGRSHLRLEVRRRHGPPADERVDQRHHPARDQESNIPHESGLLGQLAYVATPASNSDARDWLDIQNNMLSGRIPDNSFKGLRMSSLNISNNFFAGILPKFNSPIWEF